MAAPANDNAPSGQAASSVFGTVELLETIICELPWQDILVHANRVSSTWNKTIKTSPQIRQKLHMPTKNTAVVSPEGMEEPNRNIHGFLDRIRYRSTISLNPMLQVRSMISTVHADYTPVYAFPWSCDPFEVVYHVLDILFLGGAFRTDGEATQQASYNRMFLTKPPCTTMDFHPYAIIDRNGHERHRVLDRGELSVHDPQGITYGSAVNAISKSWKSWTSLTVDEGGPWRHMDVLYEVEIIIKA
jgi:hypothetical protein